MNKEEDRKRIEANWRELRSKVPSLIFGTAVAVAVVFGLGNQAKADEPTGLQQVLAWEHDLIAGAIIAIPESINDIVPTETGAATITAAKNFLSDNPDGSMASLGKLVGIGGIAVTGNKTMGLIANLKIRAAQDVAAAKAVAKLAEDAAKLRAQIRAYQVRINELKDKRDSISVQDRVNASAMLVTAIKQLEKLHANN